MKNETFEKDPNAHALLKTIKSGQMVAFIGAGLSCGNGADSYPPWFTLVQILCRECRVEPPIPLSRWTTAGTLQELAQQCFITDRDAYIRVLTGQFAKRITSINLSYMMLMRAAFKSYVTTNFDPLLSIAHASNTQRAKNMIRHVFPHQLKASAVSSDQGGVFYIHGLIEQGAGVDPNKVVLSKSDFESAYDENGYDLGHFWKTLLMENHVLFLGCQLGEPEFEIVFHRCVNVETHRRDKYGLGPHARFVLLADDSANTTHKSDEDKLRMEETKRKTDERFNEYGITVVRYEPVDTSHVGLLDVLEQIAPAPIVSSFKEERLEY